MRYDIALELICLYRLKDLKSETNNENQLSRILSIVISSAKRRCQFHNYVGPWTSLLSGRNVRWPRRMLPPGESRWVCTDGKDVRTDGRTPDCYITLTARNDQRNKPPMNTQKHQHINITCVVVYGELAKLGVVRRWRNQRALISLHASDLNSHWRWTGNEFWLTRCPVPGYDGKVGRTLVIFHARRLLRFNYPSATWCAVLALTHANHLPPKIIQNTCIAKRH